MKDYLEDICGDEYFLFSSRLNHYRLDFFWDYVNAVNPELQGRFDLVATKDKCYMQVHESLTVDFSDEYNAIKRMFK